MNTETVGSGQTGATLSFINVKQETQKACQRVENPKHTKEISGWIKKFAAYHFLTSNGELVRFRLSKEDRKEASKSEASTVKGVFQWIQAHPEQIKRLKCHRPGICWSQLVQMLRQKVTGVGEEMSGGPTLCLSGYSPGSLLFLQKPLGSGGAAVVYSGYDLCLARKFVIKLPLLSAEGTQETMDREKRILHALDERLVKFPQLRQLFQVTYDCDFRLRLDDHVVNGAQGKRYRCDLFTAVTKKHPRLPSKHDLMHFFVRMLDALEKARAIHQDIKLENILLRRSGMVLADWGLALLRGEEEDQKHLFHPDGIFKAFKHAVAREDGKLAKIFAPYHQKLKTAADEKDIRLILQELKEDYNLDLFPGSSSTLIPQMDRLSLADTEEPVGSLDAQKILERFEDFLWSLYLRNQVHAAGIALFIALTGYVPHVECVGNQGKFQPERNRDVLSRCGIDPQHIDLVMRMLEPNPWKRITTKQLVEDLRF